jgi:hypothetical protein
MKSAVAEYLTSNITMLKWMISQGYGDARTIARRIKPWKWLANPELMRADKDAEYAAVTRSTWPTIKEPILCCPNDPDDAKPAVAGGRRQDRRSVHRLLHDQHRPLPRRRQTAGEVEGGSLATRLWLAPPTKMDEHQLMEEGYYNIYGRAGARTEMPGCSLCMGNQARVAPNTTCVSTSTRNFPNRLGQGANVYLASAELASVAAVLGKLPTVEEYMEYAKKIDSMSADIYRYLNFDKIGEYTEQAGKINVAQLLVVHGLDEGIEHSRGCSWNILKVLACIKREIFVVLATEKEFLRAHARLRTLVRNDAFAGHEWFFQVDLRYVVVLHDRHAREAFTDAESGGGLGLVLLPAAGDGGTALGVGERHKHANKNGCDIKILLNGLVVIAPVRAVQFESTGHAEAWISDIAEPATSHVFVVVVQHQRQPLRRIEHAIEATFLATTPGRLLNRHFRRLFQHLLKAFGRRERLGRNHFNAGGLQIGEKPGIKLLSRLLHLFRRQLLGHVDARGGAAAGGPLLRGDVLHDKRCHCNALDTLEVLGIMYFHDGLVRRIHGHGNRKGKQ